MAHMAETLALGRIPLAPQGVVVPEGLILAEETKALLEAQAEATLLVAPRLL